MLYVLIAIGSATGGVARYWLSSLLDTRVPGAFPTGTFVVNLVGSLAIGMVLAAIPRDSLAAPLLVTGVLGGFTTFSAFSFQTVELLREHAFGPALAYVLASVTLCVLFAWLGGAVVRWCGG